MTGTPPGLIAGATGGATAAAALGLWEAMWAEDVPHALGYGMLWGATGAAAGARPLRGARFGSRSARGVAPSGLPATTAESVTDKLRRYLLDPNHPSRGTKAIWFRKALGFTQDNLDDLARQIKFDPAKVAATELTQHGQEFEQVIQIVGADGKRIDVLFVWIRNHDGIVRLVTSTLGV
jgi:hypothetical protein